jgi:hypothetical protein
MSCEAVTIRVYRAAHRLNPAEIEVLVRCSRWAEGVPGIRPANWGLRPNSVRIILQRIGGPLQGLVGPQVEGRAGMAEMLKTRWGCWHPAGWRMAYQDEVEIASAGVAALEGDALAGPASAGVVGRLAGRSRPLRFTRVAVIAVPWRDSPWQWRMYSDMVERQGDVGV